MTWLTNSPLTANRLISCGERERRRVSSNLFADGGQEMPALFLSLLSSAVVAATPLTPQPWFEFKDYPMDAFEKSWEGLTRFQLLIAPDGKIASCSIVGSSGHPSLDEKTCYLATKRAKFRPARRPGGA